MRLSNDIVNFLRVDIIFVKSMSLFPKDISKLREG
jgi:hypothetical protein